LFFSSLFIGIFNDYLAVIMKASISDCFNEAYKSYLNMLLYNQSCQHNFFPMMSPDEFESLKQDIRANGLRTPVLMYENKVLDGLNRYAACREIGVKPRTIEYVGNDPVGHVISLNLMRRHLNTSQRAMISLKIAHYKNGGIRTGQNTQASQTANLPTEASQLEVAKLLNISPRIIKSHCHVKLQIYRTWFHAYPVVTGLPLA
jgi:hypothetical protein